MKNTALLVATAAASVAAVGIAEIPREQVSTSSQPSTSDPGFVSFPIYHRSVSKPILKRNTDVTIYNISSVSYLIQLSIGTPGQQVKVAIDTGSDELWVNPNCTAVKSQDQRAECIADGQYNPGQSSTSQVSTTSNNIPYGKGDVNITYYKDSISMSNSSISLTNVIFGVATSSKDLNEGIMGLGYGDGVNLRYNNMVDSLFLQNVTKSRAFSVALGSAEASNSGVISFGGVDTKKFSGKLGQMPILGPQGKEEIRRYWVPMDSIAMSKNGGNKTYSGGNIPIVIDSGSTLSYLPSSVVTAMAMDANALWNSEGGVYFVKCDKMPADASFDFSFNNGSFRISVPWRNFFWNTGGNTCVLGAVPIKSGSVTALLGDSFMRSVYTVFDQTSNMVFMAPYANCGSNEQMIPASPSGAAANFTGECSPGQGLPDPTPQKNAAGKASGEPSKFEFWACAAVLVVGHLVFGMLL
ncbi:hypothetical protein MGG_02849 [Pyricularia oryzae 70-15]|uniref:Peptidase A1 domain-containing protein n=1 Tax=Pyricularia oryzae (strain 70-15 / ATCC MYA-4617 / FGSC 8958) TaxID=242507 RepID=G5EH92_PYRO7|nr:uncharacterized protein MGG_02849 [Pyricularia oryzae 70-15]EAQ71200.1 hypothetical protein MGCH7_ch7g607 [Pyricularia oryzae 70-15]EHA46145.1 hypothetical protein MGG_02849 [Pyricularia oryzae 70-15]KAI7913744.1 hypothetical protein M9X92_009324 [Pyricularia oryzae]KAI7918403.1 hypothetical protein M0657_007594 [Pyricularia oryzae]